MTWRRALAGAAVLAGVLGDGARPAVAFERAFAGEQVAGPLGPARLRGGPAAEGAPTGVAEDDPLTVEVWTFGPGDHPFTRFGHNALRIRDRRARTDVVYNFGTFSIESDHLALDFLQRKLKYWLSRGTSGGTLFAYRHENRTVETQELDLSPATKAALAAQLEDNAQPTRREYRYDYFQDNCSTRVRDALDHALGGRVHAAAGGDGALTLRAHALRMAADDLPLYLGLLIVLGPSTDRPIDRWAETFLPQKLQEVLREVPADGAGAVAPRPLVKAERVLFAAARPPVRPRPPRWLPAFLVAGAIAGLLFFVLGHFGARVAALRVVFGLLVAVCGLVFGLLGLFLVGAWALTPHAVVYGNQNALLFAPFTIVLAVFGVGVALGRPGAARKARFVSAYAVGTAAVACVLKLVPGARQDNAALILTLLPLWVGMFLGARAIAAALALRARTRV